MTDDVLQYRILDAEFLTSAAKRVGWPKDSVPEALFLGRSNVGKSSLLNALTGRKSLARTSKTPGRTQLLNFFNFRYRVESDATSVHEGRIVDAPGFGYANVSASVRVEWPKMMEEYLLGRANLRAVYLLVDIRREVRDEEKWLADLGRQGNFYVVLTKADKISRNQYIKAKKSVREALSLSEDALFLTSTLSGKRQGLEALTNSIASNLVLG